MKTPTPPTLTDRCRGLLEAVMGVLGLEQGRGVLAGPLALLMWFRTRRMRKEVEAFAEHFRVLMEQLLALLEAHKAGTLTASAQHLPPQGGEAEPRARQMGDSRTPRSSAPSAVNTLDHEERSQAPGSSQAVAGEMDAELRVRRVRKEQSATDTPHPPASRAPLRSALQPEPSRGEVQARVPMIVRPADCVGFARGIFSKRILGDGGKCALNVPVG